MIENNLYKDRSYSSCIHSAYGLMFEHFIAIFRRTWLPALVYALVASTTTMLGQMSWAHVVVALVALVPLMWMTAQAVALLNDKPVGRNLVCCLQMAAGWLMVQALVVVVCSAGSLLIVSMLQGDDGAQINTVRTVHMWFVTGLLVVAAVVAMPLTYSSVKFVVESKGNISTMFGQAYANGWRHWGFVTLTNALALVIACILGGVVALPRLVMYLAMQNDLVGIAGGDPSGMPHNIWMLDYAVNALMLFITSYIAVWVFYVQCYIYGRIETRMKKKHKTPQNNETTEIAVY